MPVFHSIQNNSSLHLLQFGFGSVQTENRKNTQSFQEKLLSFLCKTMFSSQPINAVELYYVTVKVITLVPILFGGNHA